MQLGRDLSRVEAVGLGLSESDMTQAQNSWRKEFQRRAEEGFALQETEACIVIPRTAGGATGNDRTLSTMPNPDPSRSCTSVLMAQRAIQAVAVRFGC